MTKNNEEIKILNQNQTEETKVKAPEKQSSTSEKVAYAAGCFVAGIASGVVGSAMASNLNKEEVNEEVVTTSEIVVEEEPVMNDADISSMDIK